MLVSIHSMLESRWFWLLTRVLLAVVFLSSGLAKLIDFEGGITEMTRAGLAPAALFNWLTIITLLGGSILLLLDRAVWLAASALATFLLLTIVIVHHFWSLPGQAATSSMHIALEHVSLIGGLLAAAIVSRLRKRLA
ncbi:DoxX family protein [Achromobacter spanius]|uniref:DoxX family protein n=1 Tax=Achromobacter spanius TaxID=217203 RepID=A0A2S0IB41_9BURK|nr:DoxX family protein [Achromobacter spanius]AVJ29252.1 DoxX family protein [Achromobacter spanius]